MLKNILQPQTDSEFSFGEMLRRCRKESKFIMQSVADQAGLSVGFISQIQREITIPSLSSLRSITGVLGRSISYFLDQPGSSQEATRAEQRLNYSIADTAVKNERLSAKFPSSVIRSVLIHKPPGYRSEPISHDGVELFYIIEGELSEEIEDTRTILRKGDSIHSESGKTHTTWNHTTTEIIMLWCGTMDVFGENTADSDRASLLDLLNSLG